jgi:type IV pilus assembly protein PilB
MYANSLSAEEKLNRKRENTLCQKCQGSGYKGRVGAYELLLLDRKIQNGISQGLTDKEIETLAVNENSMLTLAQYGIELVKDNLTTISEVIRVCKSD